MKFEKVSFEVCKETLPDVVEESILKRWHEEVKLPIRGTKDSAGYDFHMPYTLHIPAHSSGIIATCVRWVCDISENLVLMVFPRSGLGFKYGLKMGNTVGIIDKDYYRSDNEGHIMLKLDNPSDETVILEKGSRFAQGIILPFYTVEGDNVTNTRNGGMGSTGK